MYQMNRPWITLQKLSIKKAILLFRMIQPSILCKYLPLYTQFNQNRLGLDGRILPDLKVIIFCPIVILAIKTRSTAFLPSCSGEWKGLCQRTATEWRSWWRYFFRYFRLTLSTIGQSSQQSKTSVKKDYSDFFYYKQLSAPYKYKVQVSIIIIRASQQPANIFCPLPLVSMNGSLRIRKDRHKANKQCKSSLYRMKTII